MRTADGRPHEVQDLIVSDLRFKVVVFTGDQQNAEQQKKLEALAATVESERGFVKKFTPKNGEPDAVFELITIGTGKKEDVNFTDVPASLRRHWSK